jgi:hypothetical protein
LINRLLWVRIHIGIVSFTALLFLYSLPTICFAARQTISFFIAEPPQIRYNIRVLVRRFVFPTDPVAMTRFRDMGMRLSNLRQGEWGLRVTSQGWWLPKAGNTEEEYEDAYALGQESIAIADGATESSFARLWAQALVNGFISAPPEIGRDSVSDLQQWVEPHQAAWIAQVPWERLPWFAEEKARDGAFASLLGWQLAALSSDEENAEQREEEAGTRSAPYLWRAMAIGDSCLFQIHDDSLDLAFPLDQASQFDSRPLLLSSNPGKNRRVWEEVRLLEGEFRPEDMLLFATDALAHWFLREYEAGAKPWQTLGALHNQEEFAELIAALRAEHTLKNDDVTLIIVKSAPEIGASAPPILKRRRRRRTSKSKVAPALPSSETDPFPMPPHPMIPPAHNRSMRENEPADRY